MPGGRPASCRRPSAAPSAVPAFNHFPLPSLSSSEKKKEGERAYFWSSLFVHNISAVVLSCRRRHRPPFFSRQPTTFRAPTADLVSHARTPLPPPLFPSSTRRPSARPPSPLSSPPKRKRAHLLVGRRDEGEAHLRRVPGSATTWGRRGARYELSCLLLLLGEGRGRDGDTGALSRRFKASRREKRGRGSSLLDEGRARAAIDQILRGEPPLSPHSARAPQPLTSLSRAPRESL